MLILWVNTVYVNYQRNGIVLNERFFRNNSYGWMFFESERIRFFESVFKSEESHINTGRHGVTANESIYLIGSGSSKCFIIEWEKGEEFKCYCALSCKYRLIGFEFLCCVYLKRLQCRSLIIFEEGMPNLQEEELTRFLSTRFSRGSLIKISFFRFDLGLSGSDFGARGILTDFR